MLTKALVRNANRCHSLPGSLQEHPAMSGAGNLLGPTTSRRDAGKLLLAALGSGLFGPHALAEAVAYPQRPIRLIVPFAAGGGADVLARLIGEEFRAQHGVVT